MTVAHEDRVVDGSTGRPAVTFPDQLAGLVRFIEPEVDLDDVVLDLCCGTGPVARALAPRVRHVLAFDLAPDVLEQGKRAADRDAITNVTFAHGDALELPYLGCSFTLVITRYSLHGVADPEAAVREMVRVSRPGAGIIIADLIRPEGAADPTRLERLRNPAHRGMLTAGRVAELLVLAGAEAKRFERFDVVRPLEPWLAGTPDDAAAQIRTELRAELAGGPETGLRPVLADGELSVTHSHLQLAARAH